MATTISTEMGEYVIFQADRDIESLEGDVKAGDWLYQPADWQGDTFSPSYPTFEEARDAALEHVYREISDRDAE